MTISEILKNSVYAIVFGFMGLIIGIWFSDLLYGLFLKNMERVTTVYISMIIIVLIAIFASLLGFTRGKSLLD